MLPLTNVTVEELADTSLFAPTTVTLASVVEMLSDEPVTVTLEPDETFTFVLEAYTRSPVPEIPNNVLDAPGVSAMTFSLPIMLASPDVTFTELPVRSNAFPRPDDVTTLPLPPMT
ncbi:hypothetical protein Busp01_05400 [Trinickia caryophylli]|nr:hypothetical protein Busp01_05400 [Trinickia caryophylli]